MSPTGLRNKLNYRFIESEKRKVAVRANSTFYR